MKVKGLIEKLQSFDPELIVVISGYKGGVDEVECAVDVSLKLDAHAEWYYGKYEVVECETMPIDCNAIYIH
jgi:hypothetical protein